MVVLEGKDVLVLHRVRMEGRNCPWGVEGEMSGEFVQGEHLISQTVVMPLTVRITWRSVPPPPSVSLFAITRFLCSSYILPEIPLSTSKQTKLVDPVFTLTRATNSSWNRINFVPCEVIRSREPIFAVCGPRGALCTCFHRSQSFPPQNVSCLLIEQRSSVSVWFIVCPSVCLSSSYISPIRKQLR